MQMQTKICLLKCLSLRPPPEKIFSYFQQQKREMLNYVVIDSINKIIQFLKRLLNVFIAISIFIAILEMEPTLCILVIY
jgi:hypothetical protein